MSNPEMIPVTSSLIKSIGYDEEKEELRVSLKYGGDYLYQGVPYHLFESLRDERDGGSVGGFFMRNIKGKYDCKKVF